MSRWMCALSLPTLCSGARRLSLGLEMMAGRSRWIGLLSCRYLLVRNVVVMGMERWLKEVKCMRIGRL